MESPRGHCLWISNINNCTEANFLNVMVKVQIAITTMGWVLALITLILNTKLNKGQLKLMKSNSAGRVPNPIPSILTFWGLSSFIRMIDEFILINDWVPYYRYRKLIQGISFWLLSVGSTWYLMGIIFNIPRNFTTQFYKANPNQPKPHVLIWVPSTTTANIILYANSLAMLVINTPLSFLAGQFWDEGEWRKGFFLLIIEHIVGAILLFFAFIKSVYYGYKLYRIVQLHEATLLASKKVKAAFANMRNTFLVFAMFNSFAAPGWMLVPAIYNWVPQWNNTLYLIIATYFRIGVSIVNICIVGNLLFGLIVNLRASSVVTSDPDHKLVPLSSDIQSDYHSRV